MSGIFNLKQFQNLLKAAEQYGLSEDQKFRFEKNAYEYRFITSGVEMPEKFQEGSDSKEVSIEESTETYVKEAGEVVEITPKLMRQLLKEAGVKFFSWAKADKLLELCKNNNLIEA